MSYLLSDYQYILPEDRIAQHPVVPAHNSKLLVADCTGETLKLSDHHFFELPELLQEHTLLIANNSQVFASRIILHDVQVILNN
jgi:S-adenosylmethionine:tRNA ribosyltransferase-isomerase